MAALAQTGSHKKPKSSSSHAQNRGAGSRGTSASRPQQQQQQQQQRRPLTPRQGQGQDRRPQGSGGRQGQKGRDAAGAAAAAASSQVINLTAQLERNFLEHKYAKVVDLFEAFVQKGRDATKAEAAAAQRQQRAARQEKLEQQEGVGSGGGEQLSAAADAAAGADAGAVTAASSEAGGKWQGKKQQQQQQQQQPAGAADPPAPLAADFRPDRRCFALYFKALGQSHFESGLWEKLAVRRVRRMMDLEAEVYPGAAPTREALQTLLAASHCSGLPHDKVLELFDKLRAAGGGGHFPVYRVAIIAAMRSDLERASRCGPSVVLKFGRVRRSIVAVWWQSSVCAKLALG